MPVECAITERPLTIVDLPEWLPAVLEPTYDQVLPALLGGDPIILPAQMPTGLPATAAAELAAALVPRRAPGTSRTTPVRASGPAVADSTVVFDEAGCARLLGFLAQIPDRRARRGRRYPLPYLLALPVVAMPAHHIDIAAIAEWVADAPDSLLLALGASTGRAGRPRRPDGKTITVVLATHGEDYDQALCAFTAALARDRRQPTRSPLRRCPHVDGKAQKGATGPDGRTPMLLSARADDGTVAAQRVVPVDKSGPQRRQGALLRTGDPLPDRIKRLRSGQHRRHRHRHHRRQRIPHTPGIARIRRLRQRPQNTLVPGMTQPCPPRRAAGLAMSMIDQRR